MVRAAFRHYARNYLETMRAPVMGGRYVRDRVSIENPADVDAAFAVEGPMIFIGLHFGSLELPGFYLIERGGRPVTAPMEAVDDPAIQAWFVRTRGVIGVRLVSLAAARRELAAALERGEVAGLIADRDVTGGGLEVPFFGVPAPIPVGPGLLAVQSGVPAFAAGVWRTGPGRYRGRLERIEAGPDGSRRERVARFLEAETRAFEQIICRAPEQWWAIFFPIWPDLAEAADHRRLPSRRPRHERHGPGDRGVPSRWTADRPGRPARPHPGLGRDGRGRGDPRRGRDRRAGRDRDHRPRPDRRRPGRLGPGRLATGCRSR